MRTIEDGACRAQISINCLPTYAESLVASHDRDWLGHVCVRLHRIYSTVGTLPPLALAARCSGWRIGNLGGYFLLDHSILRLRPAFPDLFETCHSVHADQYF